MRAQDKMQKNWEEEVLAEEDRAALAAVPGAEEQEVGDNVPTDSESESGTSEPEPNDDIVPNQQVQTPREKTPTPPKKTPKRGRGRPPKDKKKKSPKQSPKAVSDKDVMIDYLNQCLAAETKKVVYRDRKIKDLKTSLSNEQKENQRLKTQLPNPDHGKKKNQNSDSQTLLQLKTSLTQKTKLIADLKQTVSDKEDVISDLRP